MSGGGYLQSLDISNDAATFLISYDSANAHIWNASTEQWDNVFSHDRLPTAFQTWGGTTAGLVKAFTTNALVCAPSDGTRVYALVLNTGGGGSFPAMVWRSSDRCASWVDTGYTVPAAVTVPRGIGPKIAVDPANPDVVYVQDNAGVVHRSFDAGATWERPTDLTAVMTQAVTTAGTADNGTVITMGGGTPANVQDRANYTVYAANISRLTSITAAASVASDTATTATLDRGITGAIVSGDTIVFGIAGGMAFDPSSGTTGGRTNTIYIGFGYGTSAVYVSTDAGVTWSATTGGPATVRHLRCSHDGVVYACSNLEAPGFALTDAGKKNAWKLASGTWTNFTSITGPSSTNVFNSVAADPLNAGHVVFMLDSGGVRMSSDYGSTFFANISGQMNRVATDVPWLATTLENFQSNGMCMFDPVVSNRLWIAEGIGIWACSPTFANTAQTLTSRNKNWQGLIVDQIVKPPGVNLIVAVQDRAALVLEDLTEEPADDVGIITTLGSIASGWGIDYAKSDPTFLALLVNSNVWVSSDSGSSWTKKTAQIPSVNSGGNLAVQTPLNMVWFPANNAPPGYTTDGGDTWNSCLFAGSTLSTGWSTSLLNNRHIVVADPVDGNTYYAVNNNSGATGGVWKSTDSGATWTNMTGGVALSTASSHNAKLIAVPGETGHLFYSNGTNSSAKLKRSVDGGATWVSVSNTGFVWNVAAGKEMPGKSHPAIFIAGTLNGETDAGIYRADDFTGDTSFEPEWTRLSGPPSGNMDYAKDMCGDLEEAGKVYIGFGSSGYAYGELDPVPAAPYQSPESGGAGAPLRRRAQYESYDTIVRRQKIREIEELKKAILARGAVAPRMAEKAREFIPYNDGMSIKAMISELVQAQQELEEEDEVMRVFAILH